MGAANGQLPPPKFPVQRAAPVLALPRRRAPSNPPFAENVTAAARESINNIMEVTRANLQTGATVPSHQLAELERSLRQLELSLNERQRLVNEAEARVVDRERDLAEAEALLQAREKLLSASRRDTASPISTAEKTALEQLRETLQQQEASLKEAKHALRERELFLDESEAKLFAKVQAQQEKESELEQREEDLRARLRRDREQRALTDPKVADELRAEQEAARKRDEFRE
jgi:chromosome segregation ATPase